MTCTSTRSSFALLFSLISIFLISSTMPAMASCPDGLLENYNFSASTPNANWSKTSSTVFQTSTNCTVSGSVNASIRSNSSASGSVSRLWQDASASPGNTYTVNFSVFVHAANRGDRQVRLQFRNSSGGLISQEVFYKTTSGCQTNQSLSAIAPAGTETVRVEFYCKDTNGSDGQFAFIKMDAVCLTEEINGTETDPPGPWVFECEDSDIVECYAGGSKNVPSVTVNVPGSEYQVVAELTYKLSNPPAQMAVTAGGTTYLLDKVLDGAFNARIYRGIIPGSVGSVTHVNYDPSASQSLKVYAFRSSGGEGMYQSGVFTEISGYRNTYPVAAIPIPVDDGERDITVEIPVSELTDDCRILHLTAEAGGVTETVTINGPVGACCINVVNVVLENVPAGATEVNITAVSPSGSGCSDGQSFTVAGGVHVSVDCAVCEPCTPPALCHNPCPRSVSNTADCGQPTPYQLYLVDVHGVSHNFGTTNSSWVECDDNGTARYTATFSNGGETLLVDATFYGGSSSPGSDGPKENNCDGPADKSDWYYYTDICGTIISNVHGVFTVTNRIPGTSFQRGTGANVTNPSDIFGASGWIELCGGDAHWDHGDFNLELGLECDCPEIHAVGHTDFTICPGEDVTFCASTDAPNSVYDNVEFIRFNSSTSNPYSGGTEIGQFAVTANGGTNDCITTSDIPEGDGTYFVYAILDPTPTDADCRPYVEYEVTVRELHDLHLTATPPSVCTGGSSNVSVTVSGGVGNYTYSYTRSDGGSLPGSTGGASAGVQVNNITSDVTVTVTVLDNGTGCVVSEEITITLDPCGKIGDRVFEDVNNNGQWDPGEGLDNVTVTLKFPDGSTQTMETGDDGSGEGGYYLFEDLLPGSYMVLVDATDLPAYLQDPEDATVDPDGPAQGDNMSTVVLGPNGMELDEDFGYLSCPKDPDINQMGQIDLCSGESVIFEITSDLEPGATYTWDFGDGANPASATGPGPHSVQYVDVGVSGSVVKVTSNKPGCPPLVSEVTIVRVAPTGIAAIIAECTAGGEGCCPGQPIQFVADDIMANHDYDWDFGPGAMPATATGPGPHNVVFATSGDKTVELTVDPNFAGISCPETTNQTITVSPCGKIGDRVFEDVNNSGQWDATSAGITEGLNGITVTLTYPDGSTEEMVTMNGPGGEPGYYLFENLLPGNYTVTVDANDLPLYLQDLEDATVDPDGPIPGDNTSSVALGPNEMNLVQDFGYLSCPKEPDTNNEDEINLCSGESTVFELISPVEPGAVYEWDFGDGAIPETGTGAGPFTVQYVNVGVSGSFVTVSIFKQGCPPIVSQVAIVRVAPVGIAEITSACIGGGNGCCVGAPVQFTAGMIQANHSYDWDFGPGASPATATGAGPHNVVYATDGARDVTLTVDPNFAGISCPETVSEEVIINPLPVVTLADAGPFCIDDAAEQLVGAPTAGGTGTYSGTGVSASGLFTPSIAGAGDHMITYSFTDDDGCSSSASITITVNPLPVVSLDPAGPYCIDGGAVQLNGQPTTGGSGVYSGMGVSASGLFTPANATAGDHEITYTFTDDNGCVSAASITITVNDLPVVSVDPAGPFCDYDGTFQMIGSPTGGTFSGDGVTASGVFDPGTGAGSYVITYTYEDANTCVNFAQTTVVVNEQPFALAGDDATIPCLTEITIGAASGVGPDGATYEWSDASGVIASGTIGGGDNGQTTVSPLIPTTYTLVVMKDGCENEDEVTITPDCNPSIEIIKTAGNAADGEVEYILAGQDVEYTYVVTNTGDTYLSDIDVTDDILGDVCIIAGPLAPGASETCTLTATAVTEDVINVATATGNPTDENGTDIGNLGDVTDTDPAEVDVVDPSIEVVKTAGNAADGEVEYILAGQDVEYTYVVTNTGDTYLTDIAVTDDILGDVCTIAGPLAPGASETCTLTATAVTEDVINMATVTGNPSDMDGNDLPDVPDVTDTDPAEVDVVDPSIEVVKTAGNAADGEVEYILAGQDVEYTYVVTNTGDTYLTDIAVTDDILGDVCTIAGPLAPGASETCTLTATAVTEDVINVATVTGNPSDMDGNDLPDVPDVTDTDPAEVDVVDPSIEVVKTAGNAADGEVEYILAGQDVEYTYVVTNTGDTYLTDIAVTDDILGDVCTIAGPLAPGASETCTLTATAVTEDVINVATVTGNPSDMDGNDLPDVPDVTDTDPAEVDVVDPSIEVVKTAGNAADGEVEYILAGQDVEYTYVVTNTGDTYLTDIAVTDDILGDVCTIAGPLAPGASETCTLTATAVTEDVINVATVTGNPSDMDGNDLPDVPDVTDTDPAEVDVVDPSIEVVKTAGNAADGEVEYILAGQDVEYTYVVTNTGDTYLTDIAVTDDILGDVCTIAGPLAPGASETCTLTATAVTEDVINVATVTGNPSDMDGNDLPDVPDVTDTDPAEVDVVDPSIEVVKTAGNAADGEVEYILAGQDVEYTYVVTNTGDTYLTDIAVTDDILGDVCTIAGPLAPGASETCTLTATAVTEDVINVATVTGNPSDMDGNDLPDVPDVTDTDPAEVDVVDPSIEVVKTAGNAADGEVEYILAGQDVEYTYVVTNTGDTYLTDIAVTDDILGDVCTIAGPLAPGASETCTLTATAVTEDVINVATVTGNPSDMDGNDLPDVPDVTDTDPAEVDVVDPSIEVVKTAGNAADGEVEYILAGQDVEYTYVVTNTGDTYLTDIAVTDDILGDVCTIAGPLAPGASETCTLTATAVTEDVINVATVTGNPSDMDGNDLPDVPDVTDTDPAEVDVVDPSIEVVKTAGNAADGEVEYILAGQDVEYTYVVTNTGDTYLTDIAVTDDILGDVCTIAGPLAPGASETCTLTATAVTEDVINVATVTGNPSDMDGNDLPDVPDVTDTDPAEVDVVDPSIEVVKTAGNAADGEVEYILAGQDVEYTYVVTNTGDTYLTDIAVTDDILGDVCTIAGPLAPGASETCTLTATAVTEDVINVATVTGNPSDMDGNDLPDVPDVTDTDPAEVDVVDPSIEVVKTAGNAADGEVEYILAGQDVEYTYVVTNTGDTYLTDIAVTDDILGDVCTIAGPLAPGASETCTLTATAVTEDVINVATVTGNPSDMDGNDLPDVPDVTDTDPAEVDVVDPSIEVVKTAGNAADGEVEYILAGQDVEYTYVVTNTGDTYLTDIAVTDDILGDVCTIAGPLAPGASETCTLTATAVTEDVINVATVTGNPSDMDGNDLPDVPDVTDTDPAEVDVVDPSIEVVKTAGNAADGEVEYILAGQDVEYTYVVTNTGDTYLTDIAVTDDILGDVCTIAGPLAPGASETCTLTATAVTEDVINVATVTGNPSDMDGNDLPDVPDVTDTDPAEVDVVDPSIEVVKTAGNAADGEVEYILAGQDVEYTYVVTNTGDTYLTDIAVTDDILGDVCTIAGPLAPGASETCTLTATAVTEDVINVATVTGNPSDEDGNDLPDVPDVDDTDDAEVDVVDPSIEVVKTAGNAADGEVEFILAGQDVEYTYVVTNTGDTYLTDIAVTDDILGDVCTIAGPLAPGASETCTLTATAVTEDVINVATVTGNPSDEDGNDLPDVPDVDDTDDAEVDVVDPSIEVVKTAGNAADGEVEFILAGQDVEYTYVVTNTGDTYLTDIAVTDDILGDVCTIAGPLAPGASETCTLTATAVTEDVINVATVTGNPSDEDGNDLPDVPDVDDTDDAEVDVVDPSIEVVKTAGNAADGEVEFILAGQDVEYTYVVTNTGDTYLTDIAVTDDILGDVCTIAGPLAPGASETCTLTATAVTEDVINVATVTGNPSDEDGNDLPDVPDVDDTDDAEVDVVDPSIEVVKTAGNAADGEVEFILAGQDVEYTYVVTNTGDTYLTDIAVTDDILGDVCTIAGPLAPGASETCTLTATAVTEDVINVATVTGNPSDEDGNDLPDVPDVDDTDDAEVDVVDPSIEVVKTAGNAADGEVEFILAGQDVEYTYVVTNTGDTYLTDIAVTDDILGDVCTIAGPLAPGASETCTLTATAVTEDVINVATVTGNPSDEDGNDLPDVPDVDDTDDAEVDVVDPSIEVVKTAGNAADGEVEYILAGQDVEYTYVVTNTGDTYLTDIAVTDDILGDVCTIAGPLAPGASETCTLTATAVTEDVINVATVTGNPSDEDGNDLPDVPDVDDTDDAEVDVVDPSIEVVKTAGNAADGEVEFILAGQDVEYTYVVTNTGDTYLTDIAVTDDILGDVCTIAGPLAPGASETCTLTATAVTEDVINVATVTGNPSDEDGNDLPDVPDVDDTDDAEVDVVDPSIEVVKTAGNAADGEVEFILAGQDVEYTYVVTNTGDTYLTDIAVTDDILGDVCTIAGPLAPGASETCTLTATAVTEDVINVATVTGNPSDEDGNDLPDVPDVDDTDDAEVDVVDPSIEVVKTAGNAADGEVEFILAGQDVEYTYVVTNTGDTYLTDIAVTDDILGDVCTIAGPLAPGASETCTLTATAVTEDVINVATVTGNPSDEDGNDLPDVPDVDDTDDAEVDVVDPSIEVVKTAGNAADGEVEFILAGQDVEYTYVVTNTGDTYLTDIAVTDDILGDVCTIAGPLAPGASETCTLTATAVTEDVINVATVTGNPSDEDGNDLPDVPDVDDTDDAEVDVVDPSIEVVKTAGNAADGEVEFILAGQDVEYTYVVTNTGDTYLTDIAVTDDILGDVCTIAGPLAPGASETCTLTATAVTEDVINVATVTGNPSDEDGNDLPDVPDVDDTDDAEVDVVDPSIEVVKTAGNAADGEVEFILAGQDVEYTYVVTNTGDTYLTDIAVTDDILGDVCTIAGPLAPGASETCTLTATAVTEDVINVATVTGNPSDEDGNDLPDVPDVDDTDDAEVDVVDPSIEVVKTAGNAADGEVEFILAGQDVEYTYVVTNTGDTYLTDIAVTDDILGDVCTIAGPLAPGASETCTLTATAVTEDVINVATVTGNPSDEDGNDLPDVPDVDDTDDAEVDVVDPAVSIVKLAGDAADGDIEYINAGEDVEYTYTVTNDGDTYLTDIVVTDDILGDVCTVPGPLAPGASTVCTAIGPAIDAEVINVGTVVANPSDEDGNDLADIADVTANDDAEVNLLGSIGDMVFSDNDSDGEFDSGEGINGVTVTLTYPDGSTETMVTMDDPVTGEAGYYLFEDLIEGMYTVTVDETTLPDYLQGNNTIDPDGGDDSTSDVDLAQGENNDLQDFGYQPLGSIGDLVFIDADGNGAPDADEGINGVTVTLTLPDGMMVSTVTMDGPDGQPGYYIFEDLIPGDYTVTVTDGDGTPLEELMNHVDPDGGNDATSMTTLDPATMMTDLDQDFGYECVPVNATILAECFDFDIGRSAVIASCCLGQLIQFSSEETNADFTYTWDFGPTAIPSTATGPGPHLISYTEAGTFDVSLTVDPGNPNIDCSATDDQMVVITNCVGSVSGIVEDDKGTPISGVIITLVDGDPATEDPTTETLGDGTYIFEDVDPGDYTVVETQPEGYASVTDLDREPDGDSNEEDPTADNMIAVTVEYNEADGGNDFIESLGSIGDLVFIDANGNGVPDPGEGINGVTVTLGGDADATMVTVDHPVTGEPGHYLFDDLLAGDYTITVTDGDGTPLEDHENTVDPEMDNNSMSAVTLAAAEDNLLQDFGYEPLGSIGDTVFEDTNGNGTQDVDEPGLPGVTVTLTYPDGSTEDMTTGDDGDYLFDDLLAGDYIVTVDETTVPESMQDQNTADPDGPSPAGDNTSMVTLTQTDLDDLDQDFGYQPIGSIGDTVFEDTNGNGTQDVDEPGLPGVTVTLTYPDGSTEDMTTGDDGEYLFDELPVGDYTVTVDNTTVPASMADQNTADPDGPSPAGDNTSMVTLTTDVPDDLDQDFGYQPLGSIGDTVFEDTNGNGTQDVDEPGLPGVTVTLTYPDGSTEDMTTGDDGEYLFDELPVGDYTVTVDNTTVPASMADQNTADPDGPSPAGDNTSMVTLTTDVPDDLDQDFGYQPLGSIGDTVFEDTNGNGTQDVDEPGLPGVTVTLTYPDGSTEDMTTGDDGEYLFDELPVGDYTVTVDNTTVPASMADQNTADPDGPSPAGDNTSMVTLTTDVPDDLDQDFGYQPLGSIGDTVFEDTNGNGTQDVDEPGLPGVTVTLTYPDGSTEDMTTGDDGEYLFDELPVGDYTVTVDNTTVPASMADQNTADPDGPSPAGDNTSMVTLTTDVPDDLDQDFGYQPLGSIGDTVFEDTNGNGTQDVDEPGLPGVTVTLTYPDGSTEDMTTGDDGEYLFDELPVGDYTVTVDNTTVPASMADQNTADPDGPSPAGDNTSMVTLTTDVPDDLDQDFGYQPLGSIGDTVFEDTNGNGTQDVDEPGLPGVTVTLTYPDGSTEDMTTGDDGDYLFDELPVGDYTVTVDNTTVPASMADQNTADPDGPSPAGDNTSMVTLTSDVPDDLDQDFGYQPLGRIGDTVFEDTNGNGTQDVGELGLANVTVTLTNPDGSMETMMTNDFGMYLFDDLPVGDYTVTVDETTVPESMQDQNTADPDGPSPAGDNTSMVTLTVSDLEDLDQDFGYQPLGSIGDLVFIDADGSGAPDAGEGVNGVTVTLTLPGGGTDTRVTMDDPVSGEAGYYLFEDLPAGMYTVTVTDGDGTELSDLFNHVDPDGGNNSTSMTTLSTATTMDDLTQDFGYECATIDATILAECFSIDIGRRSAIIATCCLGELIQFTAQETNPDYTYTWDFGPTTSPMTATGPGPHFITYTEAGTFDVSLTIDPGNGNIDCAVTNVQMVEIVECNGTVSGIVETDDGTPLEGVKITLDDGDPATMDAMTFTLANGTYLFNDVEFGDYTLIQEQPMGYNSVSDDDRSPETPSDPGEADGVVDNMISVRVLLNENDADNDFVEATGSIGDLVFIDADGSGTPDDGEGIGGVTVMLTPPSDIDLGNGDGMPISAVTQPDGSYLFDLLPEGMYMVDVVDGPGTPLAGAVNTVDPDGTNDGMSEVDLGLSEDNVLQDFGYSLPPDITPVIQFRPNAIEGTENVAFRVIISEILGVPTDGEIIIRVNKDPNLENVVWDGSATQVGPAGIFGYAVTNDDWTFDDSNPTRFEWRSKPGHIIPGNGSFRFGWTGDYVPGATEGMATFTVTIVTGSGSEINFSNNVNAEQIFFIE